MTEESLEYDWVWQQPLSKEVGINDDLPGDQLDRAKYAQFLTSYLARFTDDSYVMNLNAEWGAGKSWFLQRWYYTVKQQHPAAYIDAWKSDFSDDPLLTVASGLLEALESSAPPNAASEKYKASFLRKSGQFIKGVSKGALMHQANRHLGEDATAMIKAGMSEVSETVVSSVIKDHRHKLDVIAELKKNIENWITLITNHSKLNNPMFVFIDELDRCRPTYAIELLETVKHLFDVKGLVFVIATNTDQLQHSIKAVYGSEFDAQRYLYRFFNRSFTLKKPDLLSFIQTQPVFTKHLSKDLLSTCDGDVIVKDEDVLANNLAAIAESFDFDLRTTLQWMDQLAAIYSEEKNRQKYFWVWASLLIALKIKGPEMLKTLFVERVSSNRFGSEITQDITRDFKAILPEENISRRQRVVEVYVTSAVAKKYAEPKDLVAPYQDFYKGINQITSRLFISISNSLARKSTKISNWGHRSKEDFPPEAEVMTMAAQKFFDVGADRTGYIDLVELASDLK